MPEDETAQSQTVMGIVHDLESFLDIEAIAVGVQDLWNSKPPEAAKGGKLFDLLAEVRSSLSH